MMGRRTRIAWVLAAAIVAAGVVTSARLEPGVISGLVTDAANGRPLPDASVMLTGIDVGLARTTNTDAAGHFEFRAVPAGHVLVSAAKARYLSATFGAVRPNGAGEVISLAAGTSRADLKLALVHCGALEGRVIDAAGQPVIGSRVRVFGRRTIGDEVQLTGDAGEPATIVSDDRGAFRVFDLPPGDYVVGAQPRGLGPGDARRLSEAVIDDVERPLEPPPSANGASVGYGPVYFPNASTAATAGVVTIRAGEERSGVDLRVSLSRFARVDGVIAGMDRVAVPHQITMRSRGFDASGSVLFQPTTRAGADGRFSFANVPPGDYTIVARTQPPPQQNVPGIAPVVPPTLMWAMAEVIVGGEDITNVRMTWQTPMTINGRVVQDGETTPPADVRVRVAARSTPATGAPNPPEVTISADGRFTLSGLLPGRYWITAAVPANPTTQVADWRVASAMVNGQDALDTALELGGSHAPGEIVITVTDAAQQIDGTVRDAKGKAAVDCPVIVFPANSKLWFPQSHRIVMRRTNDKGQFLFGLASALPPGEYFVAAAPGLTVVEQFDPVVLADLTSHATRVTLAKDGSQTVSLVRR